MVVKDAFPDIESMEVAISKASEDKGENTFQSEWSFSEAVHDGVQQKLWKPSSVFKEVTNEWSMEMTYIFLTESEFSTYFLAQADKITDTRRGSLLDFNEQTFKGVMLKPSPTPNAVVDVRSLLDQGLDPSKQVITLELDNSINACRRIILRRGQGARRQTAIITPGTQIRQAQAEVTFKWLAQE